MERYNIPEKGALLELKHREDYKRKRNAKLLEIFGKGKRFDYHKDPPEIILEADNGI